MPLRFCFFTIIVLSLFVFLTGCGGNYEKKIIGKWKAVENICDEKGNCKNNDDISGLIEYTADGKMIIDDKIKGVYKIAKNVIAFEIKHNDSDLKGTTEIFYIKGSEMLSKSRIGDGETDIIKYKKVI